MKIKMNTSGRLPLKELLMVIAMFCVYSSALLEHVSISIPAFSAMKFPILYVGGICILMHSGMLLKKFLKKKYFYVLLTVLILCAVVLVSAIVNRRPYVGTNPMRTSLRLVLYLLELFSLAVWIAESGKWKYALNALFWYVLLLTVATDTLFFSRLVVFKKGKTENYLIGTKFSVSYLHMYLLMLWTLRFRLQKRHSKKEKRLLIMAMPVMIAVAIRLDCMTGVVGALLLILLLLLINTKMQRRVLRLSGPFRLFLILTATVLFPFVAERILSIPVVSYTVEEILGRDLTLTGRLMIFNQFGRKMHGHWLWGYGYGNGNVAAEHFFRCANAQNALLHWILQGGISVALAIVLLILVIFKQFSSCSGKKEIMPIAALVYVVVILGMVETTFNLCFFLWLALIFAFVNEKKPVQVLEQQESAP